MSSTKVKPTHGQNHNSNNNNNVKDGANIHENAIVTDIHIPWLYESHSVSLLILVLVVILYQCMETSDDQSENIRHGLWLCAFLFLAIGCLVFPAGPFIRPHPIIYRLLFGVNVLYAFALLMLLCQTPDDARKSLSLIDDTLGEPLKERNYAEDCSLTWSNFFDKMDFFVPAHFFGWGLKAILLRDRTLVWVWSLLWELIEIATFFFVPNFAECWWDSVIIDFIICNGIGIEFGLYLCRKFWLQDSRWLSVYEIPTICGKFRRFMMQFTPLQLEEMHWETTKNIKRYFLIHCFIITVCVVDLNGFLLKLFLWIPTNHFLFSARAMLFSTTGVVSVHQFYLYMSHDSCRKFGSQNWLMVVVLILETAIIYKCRPQPFPIMPLNNKYWLVFTLTVYLVFSLIVLRSFPTKKSSQNKKKSKRNRKSKQK